MNRIFVSLLFLTAVCLSSCGPTPYLVDVDIRKPSASGLDLVGKQISVVFLDNGDSADSLFISALSGSFADKLDAEYFGGDSLITLYCLPKKEGVEYDHRDSMINLLVETGSDVVFLFDSPEFATPTVTPTSKSLSGIFPYIVTLYAYDGMNAEDRVQAFHGTRTASVQVPSDSLPDTGLTWKTQESFLKTKLLPEAVRMGAVSGQKFMITWERQQLYFYLYESREWYESYYAVNEYRWQDAMDIWLSLLDTKNLQKKACLEHNLAMACYIQGQYELADSWMKLSAKDCKLPLTDYYASVISAKL